MKTIIIFNEVNLTNSELTVTNKQYKYIQSLEYIGGFKRFGLSIYDEGSHLKPNKKETIGKVLAEIFQNENLILANL